MCAMGGIIAVAWNVRSNALAKSHAEYTLKRANIRAEYATDIGQLIHAMHLRTQQAAAANEPPQPMEVELPADPGPPGGSVEE